MRLQGSVWENRTAGCDLRDPFARRLAGKQGQAIVDAMPKGRSRAWAMIVRTAVIDEMILSSVGNGSVDLVINLAAGLDARPWRLSLHASLRWVDVDLPEILNHKTDALRDEKPVCQYEAMTVDLCDAVERPALFARLTEHATSQRYLQGRTARVPKSAKRTGYNGSLSRRIGAE